MQKITRKRMLWSGMGGSAVLAIGMVFGQHASIAGGDWPLLLLVIGTAFIFLSLYLLIPTQCGWCGAGAVCGFIWGEILPILITNPTELLKVGLSSAGGWQTRDLFLDLFSFWMAFVCGSLVAAFISRRHVARSAGDPV